jgi:hypothetical protein
MKKYLYLLIIIMLGFSMSACGKTAAATEAPADTGSPVDSGAPADAGAAATEAPATPADSGAPADEMDGFLFAPMSGEYEPQVDVNEFIGILREEAGINGDLQLVSALPAGTAWDAVLSHYDGQAKANGWVLEKTEDVTTAKGYLCSVALFTHGNNKILLAYYPLNGEIIILQIQGQ